MLEMDFCLRVSVTMIAFPKNPKGCFVLIVVYFIFSEIKMQHFQDDALLVQEIN